MYCSVCGTQNVDGDKFCAGCGTPLENTATSLPKGVYKQVTHNIPQMTARPAMNNTFGSFDNLISIAAGLLFLVAFVFELRPVMSYFRLHLVSGGMPLENMTYFLWYLLRMTSYLLLMIYAFGFYKKRKCCALFGVGHILSTVAVILWVLSFIPVYFGTVTLMVMVILSTLITVAYHICIMVFTFAKVRNTNTVRTFCVTFFIITIALKAVFQILIWVLPKDFNYYYYIEIELSSFFISEGLMAATLLLAPKTAEKV